MTFEDRPADWVRGTLDLCVLGLLAGEETYGYQIAQALEAAGMGPIKGGTLYPLLGRLERDGLVDTRWQAGDGGPGRKYYRLTPKGGERLRILSAAWSEFASIVTTVASSSMKKGDHHGESES